VKEVDSQIPFKAILTPEPSWVEHWNVFLSRHDSWWPRFAGQGPVYCLPKGVIGVLRGEFLDNDDSEAELAFRSLCRRSSRTTIGVWDGQPIDYPLPFDLDRLQVSDKFLHMLSSTKYAPEVDWRSCPIIDGTTWRAIHHQLLGYVGVLTFDKQYRAEKRSLQDR
jgi:hypothetical protein